MAHAQNEQPNMALNGFFNPSLNPFAEITDQPNGGVMIDLNGLPQLDESEKLNNHGENLAIRLQKTKPGFLNSLGAFLKNAVNDDLNSRKLWEESLIEGLNQLGLKTEEKEFPFANACGIYSNALMQAVVSFVSNATAELLPPSGPVLCKIIGDPTEELEAQADRVCDFLNLYLTDTYGEYYAEWQQALLWFALSGNVFKKVYQDPVLNQPVAPYIKPQDLIINQGATSIETATRVTHRLKLSQREILLRQKAGFYLPISLTSQNMEEQSEVDKTISTIGGMDFEGAEYDYNRYYTLYEIHTDLMLDQRDLTNTGEVGDVEVIGSPYIVTIEASSGTVLSIYKNWKQEDSKRVKRNYFCHGCYFPGLDFYGFGLAHIVGGNAKAATMIGRQLIDAGTLSNFPGGLRVKGMRLETNNVVVGPTEFVEIDTGGLPIRDSIMMMPYNPPSETMKGIKDKLEENILNMAGAVNQEYAEFNPNAPVGTTLALIEQSSRMQSSVMRRLHKVFGAELKLIFDLFGEYLPDNQSYPYNVSGGKNIMIKSDFSPTLSIEPVSDPNINNSTQRLIRSEAVLRLAVQNPAIHNMRKIYEHIYKELKIPDPEINQILLPEEQPPEALNPLTENQNMTQNKPVKAALWQDHNAHMSVHSLIAENPAYGESPMSMAKAHIQEHQAYQQQIDLQGRLNFTLPPDLTQLDPQTQNFIAAQLAIAAQQMKQEQMQLNPPPPPPVDPGQAMLQDIEMKRQANEQKNQIEQQRLELERMKLQIDETLQKMKLEQQAYLEQLKLNQKNHIEELKFQQSSFPEGGQPYT